MPLSGALARDGNGHPIQVAARVVFKDGSNTPNVSPKSITSGQTLTLLPPPGATILYFRCDNAVTWSNTSDQVLGAYPALANVDTPVPCTGGGATYIKAGGSTTVVYFRFEQL